MYDFNSIYKYDDHWKSNWRAAIALVCGFLPPLPGLIHNIVRLLSHQNTAGLTSKVATYHFCDCRGSAYFRHWVSLQLSLCFRCLLYAHAFLPWPRQSSTCARIWWGPNRCGRCGKHKILKWIKFGDLTVSLWRECVQEGEDAYREARLMVVNHS